MSRPLLGAVEAGGTKFVVAIGTGPRDLRDRTVIPTTTPGQTLCRVADFLGEAALRHGALAALGIACFGPVDPDPASPRFGHITDTPKAGWSGTDVAGFLRSRLSGPHGSIPVGFDTDVNGAALGEWHWGAAQGLEDFVYLTVGTGIGGGGMARGRLLHGLVHPEMGHMGLPRIEGDDFAGACRFHGRCWEGLCAGPAIAKRAGMPAESLPPDHPAWAMTIRYMAHALVNLTCALSPRRIIIGGSVRKAGQLGEDRFFERLRIEFRSVMAGYITSPALTESGIATFIGPPSLGDNAGICGAIALAQAACGPGAARKPAG